MYISFCLTPSPLIKIHSMTSSQLPLTQSSVSVIHCFTILFKSALEFQWESHWQLIAGAADEHWLKSGSSLEWSPLDLTWTGATSHRGYGSSGAKKDSHQLDECTKTSYGTPMLCPSRDMHTPIAATMLVCSSLMGICTLRILYLCVCVCLSLFIPSPGKGVFSYLWPLQVQGWHAITKTALSITLTDRLKRGFNSYFSPWALHHDAAILQCCSSLPLSSAPVNHSVSWQNGLCRLQRNSSKFFLILFFVG